MNLILQMFPWSSNILITIPVWLASLFANKQKLISCRPVHSQQSLMLYSIFVSEDNAMSIIFLIFSVPLSMNTLLWRISTIRINSSKANFWASFSAWKLFKFPLLKRGVLPKQVFQNVLFYDVTVQYLQSKTLKKRLWRN